MKALAVIALMTLCSCWQPAATQYALHVHPKDPARNELCYRQVTEQAVPAVTTNGATDSNKADGANKAPAARPPGTGASDLKGSISVRARILGTPPTEVPVENYTVVNEKELKEERKLLFADDTAFYRDGDNTALLANVAKLQVATAKYRTLLQRAATAAGAPGDEPLAQWWDTRAASISDAPSGRDPNSRLDQTIQAVNDAVNSDAAAKLTALRDSLEQVHASIDKQFLSARLPLQLDDDTLALVRKRALAIEGRLVTWQAQLDVATTSQDDALQICNTLSTGYIIRRNVTLTNAAGKAQTAPPETYLRVLQGTQTIVYPPNLIGYTPNLDPDVVVMVSERQRDQGCREIALPSVIRRLAEQQRIIDELDLSLTLSDRDADGKKTTADADNAPADTDKAAAGADDAKAAAASAGKDTADAVTPTTPPSCSKTSDRLLEALEDIKTCVREGIEARLLTQLRDARVRLAPLNLDHDARVEIAIRVTRQGTTLGPDETATPVDIEERVVIRAVKQGVTFSVAPQFAMVKRWSDVRSASSTEVPSNFKPAAGATFSVRYRRLNKMSDWYIPSLGIAAHLVDFDPNQPIEVGAGPCLGVLDDHIHGGIGWNLAVSDNRTYVWLSLDFLRASDTFAALFGGGK
jgi:hypothetical protein